MPPLVATAAFAVAARTLLWTQAVSGIFGSISLTAWICLLLPQLFQNYKSKSADGLSMAFLVVWLIGDVTNLVGALFTRLAPTAIALAGYFCFADIILILQVIYYNTLNNQRRNSKHSIGDESTDPDEDSPLLQQRRSRSRSDSFGLPGSHRRHATHTESSMDPLRKIVTGEDDTPDSKPWLHNTLSILAVHVVGFLGWFASYKAGAWDHDEPGVPDSPDASSSSLESIGLALGYFSAVCYLCARIPQILKNYREKSCEGLALLFFMLSMVGNLTYGISLVAYSQDKDYLLNALPWLIGSLGTIAEDLIIFAQFRLYATRESAIGA